MLNIAVIRFGYWGKNLVRNFHDIEALRLICDTDQAKEQLVKEKYPDVSFASIVDVEISAVSKFTSFNYPIGVNPEVITYDTDHTDR